jgi:hypothetical protein
LTVAVLTVRGEGGDDDGIGDRVGVTIAASYGSIQVGEGVFLCWMGWGLIARYFIADWAETNAF